MSAELNAQELNLLEAGTLWKRPSKQKKFSRPCCRLPLKICRLLLLLALLPGFFIFIPLYMRYHVFSGQIYPLSMTDMRLIDGRISPLWCQRQVVKSNATFNAFVLPDLPKLSEDLISVSMNRNLELEDDMKEYWGFYLLRGSRVTVSACVRWPGASLIMIKGYKHLRQCAYIGDDSSEELDELLEAKQSGLLTNTSLLEKLQRMLKDDGRANDPATMKRHKAGVSFHHPQHAGNSSTVYEAASTTEQVDHESQELRQILDHLHSLRQAAKRESSKLYRPPSHLVALPALHRHRDTNVDKDERKWIFFNDIDINNVSKTNENVVNKNKEDHRRMSAVDALLKNKTVEREEILLENADANDIGNNSSESFATENSEEVFEEVLKRLRALGDRGKKVLGKLHISMGIKFDDKSENFEENKEKTRTKRDLDKMQRILIEAVREEETKFLRRERRHNSRIESIIKREGMVPITRIELTKELNEDDEARNLAAEEELIPDGYADHHEKINETTAFDMSNSELWSSFSSSEEALLECDGLILNLPLTPHRKCHKEAKIHEFLEAANTNALTYRVPADGYYFFVFSSENEVQTNTIRAAFDLQKTRYEVEKTLRACRNATTRCDLQLDFFSQQKVVLEVPLRNNDSLWNEQFVIVSECEPRSSVYLVFVIAVPIFIMTFAFQ